MKPGVKKWQRFESPKLIPDSTLLTYSDVWNPHGNLQPQDVLVITRERDSERELEREWRGLVKREFSDGAPQVIEISMSN